jgi:hypothetical protein
MILTTERIKEIQKLNIEEFKNLALHRSIIFGKFSDLELERDLSEEELSAQLVAMKEGNLAILCLKNALGSEIRSDLTVGNYEIFFRKGLMK